MISLHTDFLSLIFRVPTEKMILARRMKLVLLTTNQIHFCKCIRGKWRSVREKTKKFLDGNIPGPLRMPSTDETGGLAPDAAS